MTTLLESLSGDQASPVHDALAAGVDMLSGTQQVSFVPYVRTILPLDGYVFWLSSAIASPQQLAKSGIPSADPVLVIGSLHYASQGSQQEDETIVVRSVDFTSESEIDAFAEVAPDVMYVGTWATKFGSFKFTFSRRNSYYRQADLHHYIGDAIYPVFEAQLIDNLASFDQRQVVSNSLPIWLSMFSENTPFVSFMSISIPLYPSLLVADDLVPPYASVHIGPDDTRPLQSIPWRGPTSSHFQLCADRVRLTLYGLGNDDAMTFLDYILDYSENTGLIGLMNMPIARDGKRAQIELTALAKQKIIEFEVSYQQQSAREIARQLIELAVTPSMYPSEAIVTPPTKYLIAEPYHNPLVTVDGYNLVWV